MRQPYQVLIFPFYKSKGKYQYGIFKREGMNVWQAISGGGEEGETPRKTAKREIKEELGIKGKYKLIPLSSLSTTPAEKISGFLWGKEIIMILEFTFGLKVKPRKIKIGSEHIEFKWCDYKEARDKLEWESNKQALWEFNFRLKNKTLKGVKKNKKIIKKFLNQSL